MNKLAIISDLHQEMLRETDRRISEHPFTVFDPDREMTEPFDIIAILGDVDVPLTRSLQWISQRFSGVPVLYVPGNHDFYQDDDDRDSGDRYTLWDQQYRGRELAEKLGIHLLMDDTVVLDGVRYIGGTLWTDMATVGRGMLHSKMREAESGRNVRMNDYHLIKRRSEKDPSKFKKLRAAQTIEEFVKTRSYIEDVLKQPFDGPTAVLTHHAPHPEGLRRESEEKDPEFSTFSYCYASNLTSTIERLAPDLWAHGHIHGFKEYSVGSTKLVRNARGHAWSDDFTKKSDQVTTGQLKRGFNPNYRIDLQPQNQPKP